MSTSLKEFQDKTNALISAFAADSLTTGGSLNWTKDGVEYFLGITISGGAITSSFSAYQPADATPNAVPPPAKE